MEVFFLYFVSPLGTTSPRRRVTATVEMATSADSVVDDSWTGKGTIIPPKLGGEFQVDTKVLEGKQTLTRKIGSDLLTFTQPFQSLEPN